MKILSCNSNKELAESICSYIGVKLCKASIRKFADDEIVQRTSRTLHSYRLSATFSIALLLIDFGLAMKNRACRATFRLSDNPTVRPSVHPTVRSSDHPTVRPSDHPTVHPSDRPSVHG